MGDVSNNFSASVKTGEEWIEANAAIDVNQKSRPTSSGLMRMRHPLCIKMKERLPISSPVLLLSC
jgi:hypothetical protein